MRVGRSRYREWVVSLTCPRCGREVVSIGTYGDRSRRDITAELIADGVPDGGRFVLEPCGDVIDASQIQLRMVDDRITITLLDSQFAAET